MTLEQTTQSMDGAKLASRLLVETAQRAHRFRIERGRPPCLAAVLARDDPVSTAYARLKQSRCDSAGIDLQLLESSNDSTESEVVAAVFRLSTDQRIDGIFVQHPLPRHINTSGLTESIVPHKDVDGATRHSFASMAFGLPTHKTCSPAGVMLLLDEYGVDPVGKHVVILGRAPRFGLPMGMLFLRRNATVTYCHPHTRDIEGVVRSGDIVVASVGVPGFVRGSWIKPGSVIVDAGYFNPGHVGDVALNETLGIASLVAPVPGGVGPVTIAVLLQQTVNAAEFLYSGSP